MNKKSICVTVIAASSAVAVLTSYGYARKGWAWLLCITGCAVMAGLIALVRLIKELSGKTAQASNYRKKATYISRAEWEFLQVLREIVGSKYEVCVQAPLVSVIDKVSGGYRNELFRVADYLIVDPISFAPLLLVELNDATHNRSDRQERDRKVTRICEEAGMPLVAFTTAEAHNVPEVRKTILRYLR